MTAYSIQQSSLTTHPTTSQQPHQTNPLTRTEIKSLPKVEIHRHLEGSIRLSTIIDLCKQLDIHVPNSDNHLTKSLEPYIDMFCITDKVDNLTAFIEKMWHAQSLLKTPEILERVAYEVCEDAFQNGVKLLEIRYSPSWITISHFIDHSELTIESIHTAVVKGANKAQQDFDIVVGLIGIMDRSLDPGTARECLNFFLKNKKEFIGIDLANDEKYSCLPFKELYEEAKSFDVGLTCHAGESTTAQNVSETIINLNVTRIGHGFRSIHDEKVLDLLKKKKILLEICPISNVRTGSVESMKSHPVRKLLDAGIKICINTDDPGMFNSNILDEYEELVKHHNFTKEEFFQCNLNALEASF
ncbi:hypothetical protein HK099_008692, partial [Clydaea vesicula]